MYKGIYKGYYDRLGAHLVGAHFQRSSNWERRTDEPMTRLDLAHKPKTARVFMEVIVTIVISPDLSGRIQPIYIGLKWHPFGPFTSSTNQQDIPVVASKTMQKQFNHLRWFLSSSWIGYRSVGSADFGQPFSCCLTNVVPISCFFWSYNEGPEVILL